MFQTSSRSSPQLKVVAQEGVSCETVPQTVGRRRRAPSTKACSLPHGSLVFNDACVSKPAGRKWFGPGGHLSRDNVRALMLVFEKKRPIEVWPKSLCARITFAVRRVFACDVDYRCAVADPPDTDHREPLSGQAHGLSLRKQNVRGTI